MKAPNPVREWLICYWGVVLDVLMLLPNLALALTGHLVNAAASAFILLMLGITIHFGRSTQRTRESIRDSRARLEQLRSQW